MSFLSIFDQDKEALREESKVDEAETEIIAEEVAALREQDDLMLSRRVSRGNIIFCRVLVER